MFHRRRASSHSTQSRHPPPLATPTPSAAAAATQAFAKSQKSNGSLSAAAAAAALRTHPSPPTPVGSLPTKRMQRRDSNSTSGSPRPDLQRRGSAGSMTERSFRSPSPGRGNPVVKDIPPVPAIPADAELERVPSAHRRAASLEPSVRLRSPPPVRKGGRGVSLDRTPYSPTTSPGDAGASSRLSKVTEIDREGSQRASVNFSRPMSPPSGVESPSTPLKSTGWFAGPLTSDQTPKQALEPLRPKAPHRLPSAEVSNIQQAVQSAANAPIKKKKKKRAEGSHLTTGTTKLTGTALQSFGKSQQPIDMPSGYSETSTLRSSGDSGSETSSPVTQDRPRSWNTRAGALLSKQPSVVHERSELEEQAEKTTSANTGKKVDSALPKASTDSSHHALSSAPLEPDNSGSVPQPSGIAPGQLNSSLNPSDATDRHSSPARSAHFSVVPVDVTNGLKHQPSGRAVSPFKSALKHSPSSSVRTTSPEARFTSNHSRNASEIREPVKPKKTARVSFDETPITVASGLESSKFAAPRSPSENELDDLMKPRPALPSFGSVRGRKDVEETHNSPRSSRSRSPRSPMSASQNTLVGVERSNDFLVGGILAQDFATKQQDNAPLPPEVTSVEGTGYASDSDSSYSIDARAVPEAPAPKELHTTTSAPTEASDTTQPAAVPSLTLIPPTPAAEEEPELSIPGAFPFDGDTDDTQEVPTFASTEADHAQMNQSIGSTPNEKVKSPLAPIGAPLQLPVDDEYSDSDTSSIYSDASEDVSEMREQFISLDAVVESPIPGSKSNSDLAVSTERQMPTDLADQAPPSPTAAHWDQTTAYWRGLSERRKRELEERALEEEEQPAVDKETRNSPVTMQQKAPPAAKPKKARIQPGTQVLPPTSRTSQQAAQKPRSAIRTTMRPSSDADEADHTHMRSTMRGSGAMPTTMRGQGQSSGLGGSRWSGSAPPHESRGALQKRNMPMGSPYARSANNRASSSGAAPARPNNTRAPSSNTAKPDLTPTLQRRGSADSASSFKRQRIRASTPDGKITLRRSMRDPSPQTPPPQNLKSSRFSVRSSSPTGSTANHHMRSSLRQSVDSAAPTLRSPEKKKSRMKSPARLGFGKSSKTKQPAPQSTPPPIYKSRFGNDSDDEDVPRATFVSRFADSDDDLDSLSSPTVPSDLTPVRGIPRRAGQDEHDSTDLDDESGDERPPIPAVPSTKDIEAVHTASLTNGHTQGSALASGSLRGDQDGLAASKHAARPDIKSKRRLSFLGIGKKPNRSASVPVSTTRTGLVTSNQPRPPKLQRKNTPTLLPQVPEDSSVWPLPPLPPPPAIGRGVEGDRPNTSDGAWPSATATSRPGAGKRSSTADSVGKLGRKVSFNTEPIYSTRTGRKKKFPALRRMFGLHD